MAEAARRLDPVVLPTLHEVTALHAAIDALSLAKPSARRALTVTMNHEGRPTGQPSFCSF